MKYKAKQLKDGKWAVGTGKSYFADMVYNNMKEAQIAACEESARWHQQQMDKCETEWERLKTENKTPPTWSEWGNILC